MREQPWEFGPGLPVMDMKNMPDKPLIFQSSTLSPGLELVDIYLWTFKRHMENKELTKNLSRLVYTHLKTGNTDSVSLNSIEKRWLEFFDSLPEPMPEMIEKAKEIHDLEETRRLQHRVVSLN